MATKSATYSANDDDVTVAVATPSKALTKAELADRLTKAQAAQTEADAAARASERGQLTADAANPSLALAAADPVTTKDGGDAPTTREPMATLPKDHSYRDRVVAQADSLGIATNDSMTLEYMLWLIGVKASS